MILKNKHFMLAISALLIATASPAFATKTVTSPYVTKGKATVEWRGGFETDGDNEDVFKTRNQVAYGLTDFYEPKISLDTRNDNKGDFSALDFENKFQLLPKGVYFVDLGLRLDYSRSLNGGTDEFATKLLLAKKTGELSHMLNLEANHEIGEDSGDDWGYALAYGVSYPLNDTLSLGGEWYSDFGTFKDGSDSFDEQDHRAGPVLYGVAFDNQIKYQFGVLAGLSDEAPDATIKSTIGYSF